MCKNCMCENCLRLRGRKEWTGDCTTVCLRDSTRDKQAANHFLLYYTLNGAYEWTTHPYVNHINITSISQIYQCLLFSCSARLFISQFIWCILLFFCCPFHCYCLFVFAHFGPRLLILLILVILTRTRVRAQKNIIDTPKKRRRKKCSTKCVW